MMDNLPNGFHVLVREPSDYGRTLKVWIGSDDRSVVFVPAVLQRLDDDHFDPPPFIEGNKMRVRAFMQAMMDAAWEMGLKPAAYEEPTNELRATRSHLADMRAIVGEKLKVRLP